MPETGVDSREGVRKYAVEEWPDPSNPEQAGEWSFRNSMDVLADRGVLARTEVDEKGKTQKPKGDWKIWKQMREYAYWERKKDMVRLPEGKEISRASWLFTKLTESHVFVALGSAEKGNVTEAEWQLDLIPEGAFLTSEQRGAIPDLARRQLLRLTAKAKDEIMQKSHGEEGLGDSDKRTLLKIQNLTETSRLMTQGFPPSLSPQGARKIINQAYDIFEKTLS